MSDQFTLLPINRLTIPQANQLSMPTMPGISFEPKTKLKQLPENGQVYVEMNSAAHIRIPRDRIGQIFTTALAGCTGVAAVAKGPSDTLAGVSHFDALVDSDSAQRIEGACASESFMNTFMKIGNFIGAHEFEFHIAYATMHEQDPAYNQFDREYSQWHFLDQLQTFSEGLDVDIVMHPYEGMSAGHTLVVSVDLDANHSIQFK